jgi:hypothetical protein
MIKFSFLILGEQESDSSDYLQDVSVNAEKVEDANARKLFRKSRDVHDRARRGDACRDGFGIRVVGTVGRNALVDGRVLLDFMIDVTFVNRGYLNMYLLVRN